VKAAIFFGPGRIEVKSMDPPSPGPEEVLIRVTGCGVCGTDFHVFHGTLVDASRPPVVLGHEITGVVEEVGSDVDNVRIGQTVAVNPVVTCGRCQHCQSGRPNLCTRPEAIGFVRNGGFAEYCCAPASHVIPLRDGTPPEAGILVETLACVLNGYDRLEPRPGCSVLILGAGTVGLLWLQLLAGRAMSLVAVSEPVGFRREKALALGADMVFDPAEGPLSQQVARAGLEGFDFVVDASGNPAAVEEGIRLVRKAGTFMIFGVCPEDALVRINPAELYAREAKIIASKMPPHRLVRAARLIEAGKIDYRAVVTHRWPLERLAEAIGRFETARAEQIKVMIDPAMS